MTKALRFEAAEYQRRLTALRASMRQAELDAILLFGQESHYYFTGFDGGGYVYFQCGVISADPADPMILLTRRPDLVMARDNSLYDDVRIWWNGEQANPAHDLKLILAELSLERRRVGVELDGYGLTAANWDAVRTTMDGFCRLIDASRLSRDLRLIKSPAEMIHVREAARLADVGYEAICAAARPGVLDSVVTAAAMSAMLAAGADMPPAGPLVNSGRRALYGRGVGGPRLLEPQDQLIVEYAGTHCRYNACIERTLILGPPRDGHLRLYDVCREALDAMLAAAKPGNPIGAIDQAHRAALDAAGYGKHRYGACGYSLGATYRPSWMDVPPMITADNPLPLAPGMILFPHVMVGDVDSGLAMGLGQTILITPTGAEALNQAPLDLARIG